MIETDASCSVGAFIVESFSGCLTIFRAIDYVIGIHLAEGPHRVGVRLIVGFYHVVAVNEDTGCRSHGLCN